MDVRGGSLEAYEIATELLAAVTAARIQDPFLRERAVDAAKRACTAAAEAAIARPEDQENLLGLARGAACAAATALDIASDFRECGNRPAADVRRHAVRLVALLTALMSPSLQVDDY
jgi:hypothetical protein